MAAPRHAPTPPLTETRAYSSPDHVPERWFADRPGELNGAHPHGDGLGTPGPDQGYALYLARRLEPEIELAEGESIDDAIRGSVLIALRRASIFGRAPVIHDLRLALTIWGFLDPDPPADLVAMRRRLFAGVADTAHHYGAGRLLVDLVPESVLRSTPAAVAQRYPTEWAILTGVEVTGEHARGDSTGSDR